MRDVAHQAMGAHALGLQVHLRNMLGRFAGNITVERDWCSLWEIDRHDRPGARRLPQRQRLLVQPAGQLRRAGRLLPDVPLVRRSRRTCATRSFSTSTIAPSPTTSSAGRSGVDRPHDAASSHEPVSRRPTPTRRSRTVAGIPGYNEDTDDFVAGLDLLAAQYAGLRGCTRESRKRGATAERRARGCAKATDVKAFVNGPWWDEKTRSVLRSPDHDARAGAPGRQRLELRGALLAGRVRRRAPSRFAHAAGHAHRAFSLGADRGAVPPPRSPVSLRRAGRGVRPDPGLWRARIARGGSTPRWRTRSSAQWSPA